MELEGGVQHSTALPLTSSAPFFPQIFRPSGHEYVEEDYDDPDDVDQTLTSLRWVRQQGEKAKGSNVPSCAKSRAAPHVLPPMLHSRVLFSGKKSWRK